MYQHDSADRTSVPARDLSTKVELLLRQDPCAEGSSLAIGEGESRNPLCGKSEIGKGRRIEKSPWPHWGSVPLQACDMRLYSVVTKTSRRCRCKRVWVARGEEGRDRYGSHYQSIVGSISILVQHSHNATHNISSVFCCHSTVVAFSRPPCLPEAV